MEIDQIGPGFVAQVSGIDLSKPLADRDFDRLYRAWLDHLVVRVRGQDLDDEALQAFSARFGPLEYRPMGNVSAAERDNAPSPFVNVISNITEDGRPIGGLGNQEANWHSDMTYIDTPPTASILYAVEVPPAGGDTWFADMTAALAGMPDELRARLGEVRVKHDAAHDSIGKLRFGFEESPNPADAPGAIHPLVRRHPETGRNALYPGRRQDAWVVGLPVEESEQLLDEIWSYLALPEDVWKQVWEVGDVVIWDNRSVMHRRDGFAADARRLMRRTQVRSQP